ncbi:hypothetical protein GCM10007276_22800 [Agaricicola taiwanensis]|uniref:Lipoprotein n=1 Tax=Agaricicola taiwanensis TaxID=591372 RepID=A0A8J3DVS3_9RHOB|nr:hypothetical protein [Agaricicola taiwanensis]GGE45090.1 hypothetical protein GCM10007276_22800 [Agaricicola taiwanensis]
MPHLKYFLLPIGAVTLAACVGPKVEVPPPPAIAEEARTPSLAAPPYHRRHNPLTRQERLRVEDDLARQAVSPAPPPRR